MKQRYWTLECAANARNTEHHVWDMCRRVVGARVLSNLDGRKEGTGARTDSEQTSENTNPVCSRKPPLHHCVEHYRTGRIVECSLRLGPYSARPTRPSKIIIIIINLDVGQPSSRYLELNSHARLRPPKSRTHCAS